MSDFNNLYAPEPSDDFIGHEFEDGTVIACDYDCYLLERETSKGYTYTAQNYLTGRKLKICTRKDMPLESDIINMMKLISISDIAGAGRLQADQPVGREISIPKAEEILDTLLSKLLPKYGYEIEYEQMDLAFDTHYALINRTILAHDIEPDEIDIVCSLIAAAIIKRGRVNDYPARGMYPEMQYADMPRMPVVITVPSISLQNKVVNKLLPIISEILLDCGVIRDTLTYIERKGRESYACPKKTRDYLPNIRHRNRRKWLDKQLRRNIVIDLANTGGLSDREKSAISVDGSCSKTCPKRSKCSYIAHIETARSYLHDIQVCTHRYFISDVIRRMSGYRQLIPNYQALLVCDTYNYLQTAAELYNIEIPSTAIMDIKAEVYRMRFKRQGLYNIARETAKKLSNENARLFKWLVMNNKPAESIYEGEDAYSIVTLPEPSILRHLKNICNIAERLIYTLYSEAFFAKAEEVLAWANIKYGADTSKISLNKLLKDEDDTETQVKALYGAICDLGRVKRCITAERAKKRKKRVDKSNARMLYAKYAHNTEQEAISGVHSAIEAQIWKKASRLLKKDRPAGGRSQYILWLIAYINDIRNKAAIITKNEEYSCHVSIESEMSMLHAAPKELGKMLFTYQRERGIPVVLMSGSRPEYISFEDFKETIGLR